jgi:hypothetical protein
MKSKVKKTKYGYELTLKPENDEDKQFLKDWDYHTEIFMDNKENLKILI